MLEHEHGAASRLRGGALEARQNRLALARGRLRGQKLLQAHPCRQRIGRELGRLEVALLGARRIVEAVFEQPPLFHQQLGALGVAAGEAHLGVEQLDQVGPQLTPLEDAANRPQIGLERGIELQRLGVGLDRRAFIAGAGLEQLADLVLVERRGCLVELAALERLQLARVEGDQALVAAFAERRPRLFERFIERPPARPRARLRARRLLLLMRPRGPKRVEDLGDRVLRDAERGCRPGLIGRGR